MEQGAQDRMGCWKCSKGIVDVLLGDMGYGEHSGAVYVVGLKDPTDLFQP